MTIPTQGRFVIPEVVATHFHIRPGDQVADLGAGQGFFIEILANLTGPRGRVYACEIQKNLVDAMNEMVRNKNLNNVEVLWCDLEAQNGLKIADNSLDVAIIVNTLFQLEDKATAVNEMKRTLRTGGKLFVVDWTESFKGLGPTTDAICNEATARSLLEGQGFTFESTFDAGDHHYGLAMRKV